MKSDNRKVWVFAIVGLLACFTWMYFHPIVVKTAHHVVVDSLSNDSVDMADSIDRAFYSDSSILSDGQIPDSKESHIKTANGDSIDLEWVINGYTINSIHVIAHHWNMPDCDSIKSVSPCKVAVTNGFTEYNLHKN